MIYVRILFTISILFLTACSNDDDKQKMSQSNFPALTGSHQVGRAQYDMVDTSRDEVYTAYERDIREFTITVHYPAVPVDDAELAPYVDSRLISAFVEATEIPEKVWQDLQSNAYLDAVVATGKFPVILFSHGSGLPITGHTGQMEDLASHGYIVVGLSHSYDTPGVVLSDGRVLLATDGTVNSTEDALSSEEEAEQFFTSLMSVWVADIRFVLDQLEILNIEDKVLAGHLDLLRVGAIGHSLGGAAAFEAAYQDERILAAIDMDGSLLGNVSDSGLIQPAMTLVQDRPIEVNSTEIFEEDTAEYEDHRDQLQTVLQSSRPGYNVVFPGSTHGTYVTDVLIMADRFPELIDEEDAGMVSDTGNTRRSIHNLVQAFFNTFVAKVGEPQMGDLEFGDLDVTVFNGSSQP